MSSVLLIEPNILLAHMYTTALVHVRHAVISVRDAQSAVHAADEHRPDIVVLELQLAAHNGVEFLHEFRSYPDWQHIPVIVNTALHPMRLQASERILRDELGVVAILYKPTATLTDICRAVRDYTTAMP
jgi:DNA-binding response OmpR family regulator